MDALEEAIATSVDLTRASLPPALASAIDRVLVWLARRPIERSEQRPSVPIEVMLPGWVPLSRLLGSFYVIRPIGSGTGGSVIAPMVLMTPSTAASAGQGCPSAADSAP